MTTIIATQQEEVLLFSDSADTENKAIITYKMSLADHYSQKIFPDHQLSPQEPGT